MEQQAPRVSRPPGSLSRFGRGKGPMRPHGKGEGVVGGRLHLARTKPLSPPGRGWVRGMRGRMLRDARPPHPALRATLSRLREREIKASPAYGRGEARVRRACGHGTSRFVPRMDAAVPPHPDPLPGGGEGKRRVGSGGRRLDLTPTKPLSPPGERMGEGDAGRDVAGCANPSSQPAGTGNGVGVRRPAPRFPSSCETDKLAWRGQGGVALFRS